MRLVRLDDLWVRQLWSKKLLEEVTSGQTTSWSHTMMEFLLRIPRSNDDRVTLGWHNKIERQTWTWATKFDRLLHKLLGEFLQSFSSKSRSFSLSRRSAHSLANESQASESRSIDLTWFASTMKRRTRLWLLWRYAMAWPAQRWVLSGGFRWKHEEIQKKQIF